MNGVRADVVVFACLIAGFLLLVFHSRPKHAGRDYVLVHSGLACMLGHARMHGGVLRLVQELSHSNPRVSVVRANLLR